MKCHWINVVQFLLVSTDTKHQPKSLNHLIVLNAKYTLIYRAAELDITETFILRSI